MNKKPLILGQAPARSGCGPLEGPTGRRLARLFGLPYEAYLAAFDRANLLTSYPGAEGRGDRFPLWTARDAVDFLVLGNRDLDLDGRDVMMLGKKVPHVFGIPPGMFSRGVAALVHGVEDIGGFRFFLFPHPSGASGWWNDQANRERAIEEARRWAKDVL